MKPIPEQRLAALFYVHYRHPTFESAPGAWYLVLEPQSPNHISLINTRNGNTE